MTRPPTRAEPGTGSRPPYLDGRDGEGDLPPAIDIRVENTKNVLELLWDDERLRRGGTNTTPVRNLKL